MRYINLRYILTYLLILDFPVIKSKVKRMTAQNRNFHQTIEGLEPLDAHKTLVLLVYYN